MITFIDTQNLVTRHVVHESNAQFNNILLSRTVKAFCHILQIPLIHSEAALNTGYKMRLSQRIFRLDSLTLVDGTDPLSQNIGNNTTNQRCATSQNSDGSKFRAIPLAIVITLVWFYTA
jgi:hypothetical protein